MKRICCNISPIKDLVEPIRTFEEIVSEDQKPIELVLTLAELAIEQIQIELGRQLEKDSKLSPHPWRPEQNEEND